MDVYTPAIVIEILHKEPRWHDFHRPILSGHFKTYNDALIELDRVVKLLSNSFIDDERFVTMDSDSCRKDTVIEVSFYYVDRCITINGYIYHGHIN